MKTVYNQDKTQNKFTLKQKTKRVKKDQKGKKQNDRLYIVSGRDIIRLSYLLLF